jgi:hypothetical protein
MAVLRKQALFAFIRREDLTMFGIFKFGAGVMTGGVLAVAGMNYHLVRTTDGFTYVPKRNAGIEDTYLDIREWTLNDWTNHPDFVWSIYKNDQQELIPGLDGKLASLKNLVK